MEVNHDMSDQEFLAFPLFLYNPFSTPVGSLSFNYPFLTQVFYNLLNLLSR